LGVRGDRGGRCIGGVGIERKRQGKGAGGQEGIFRFHSVELVWLRRSNLSPSLYRHYSINDQLHGKCVEMRLGCGEQKGRFISPLGFSCR
jgi:hypothetical protein